MIQNAGTLTTIGDYNTTTRINGKVIFTEKLTDLDVNQTIGDGLPANYPSQNQFFQDTSPMINFSL